VEDTFQLRIKNQCRLRWQIAACMSSASRKILLASLATCQRFNLGENALHTMVEASGCPELNQLGTLDATRVPNPWLWFLSCLHSFSVCCLFCFPLFNLSAQTMYAKV
jgi:hypothetical protein